MQQTFPHTLRTYPKRNPCIPTKRRQGVISLCGIRLFDDLKEELMIRSEHGDLLP